MMNSGTLAILCAIACLTYVQANPSKRQFRKPTNRGEETHKDLREFADKQKFQLPAGGCAILLYNDFAGGYFGIDDQTRVTKSSNTALIINKERRNTNNYFWRYYPANASYDVTLVLETDRSKTMTTEVNREFLVVHRRELVAKKASDSKAAQLMLTRLPSCSDDVNSKSQFEFQLQVIKPGSKHHRWLVSVEFDGGRYIAKLVKPTTYNCEAHSGPTPSIERGTIFSLTEATCRD